MKKVFNPMRFLVSMLLFGCSFGFVACSDDEGDSKFPNEATTQMMFGDYLGKMITDDIVSSEDEGMDNDEETPSGVDISARVNNDTVYFDKFPVKELVLCIVKDETLADRIVEALGDVRYEVGYKPALTANKDSIKLELDPKPLKLSLVIPSNTESGQARNLLIEVKVEAGKEAAYAVENANLKFNFAVTEVLLGEGEEQAPLPDFTSKAFNFDMTQSKIEHFVY